MSKRKPLSKRVRYDVLRRCQFSCYYCGIPAKNGKAVLHIDHVTPLSQGGTDDPWNLVPACEDCNLGKAGSLPTPWLAHRVAQEWAAYESAFTDKRVFACDQCSRPSHDPWEHLGEDQSRPDICRECHDGNVARFRGFMDTFAEFGNSIIGAKP